MPINSLHPDYSANSDMWAMCRDAYNGSNAVKKRSEAYLPRLSGQDKEEYKAYKMRALFYSIMSKSVSSLIGLAMSTEPRVTRQSDSDYLFVDKTGLQFDEVFSKVLMEMLVEGRVGWLSDRADGAPAKPVIYPTEAIINWDVDDEGRTRWVVLKERGVTNSLDDKYLKVVSTTYRELTFNAEGLYIHRVYDADGKKIGTDKLITNSGKPMEYIPFFVANINGIGFEVNKSPSQDLAEVNMSHYRTSADLEHGRHFTALPTPVVTGVDSSTDLKIGASTAWVLPSEKASAKFLEFTGQGLKSLENALSEKAQQLATLSARLIDNSGNGSENPEVVRLRYASEGADLAAAIRSCETLLNLGYVSVMDMEGLDRNIDIKLNKQFFDSRMSFVELEKLVSTYLQGGISQETFVFNLKRGEILPPDSTGEAEGKTKNNGE